jgi:arylsulfatase A-like enzyme
LATGGAVYENAISPSVWTLPAHASLFTGTYTATHQTHHENTVLPDHLVTLAETLAAVGYRTCGVSNQAWVSSLTGLARGFHDFYLGGRILQPAERGGEFVNAGWWSFPAYVINKAYRQFFKLHYGDGGPWINKMAMRWVSRRGKDEPIFLFLNYKEPHLFYRPPAPYQRMFLDSVSEKRAQQVNQDAFAFMAGKVRMQDEDFQLLHALYDGEVRYLDDCLRELFSFLQARGHLENSLIIITSDHGENISEHGLMDHQYCVYDTLARIPLIVVRPGDFRAGVTVEKQVQLHDLFPTVLDLLQIDGAPREQNQAQSLLNEKREFAVIEYLTSAYEIMARRFPGIDLTPFRRTFRAIRTDRYKFIYGFDGRHELYDVAVDPSEQNNLMTTMSDVTQTLSRKLNEWVLHHEIKAQHAVAIPTFDRDIEERLKNLGYL